MEDNSFLSLGIDQQVVDLLAKNGVVTPTPIQQKTIPLLIAGQDVIGQAQTGTGKTLAFALPAMHKINKEIKKPSVIVMCPTRELALQVAKQFEMMLPAHPGVFVAALVGGQSMELQLKALRKGIQIVVGTPGRIIDHLNRKTLDLSNVAYAVLDEADEMLDMGFREDIESILQNTPAERQTALFSATLSTEIKRLAQKYQRNPQSVNLMPSEISVASIAQVYYELSGHKKFALLTRLLDMYQPEQSLVFCNTIEHVDEVFKGLQEAGYVADALHGDMRQVRRDKVMERFRGGECKILVATDVAARGIDVAGIEAVFNLDLPFDYENYVHRIGRTGRAGRSGKAYNFVTFKDRFLLRDIQRYTKGVIEKAEIPSHSQVKAARAEKTLKLAVSQKPSASSLMYKEILEKLGVGISTEELVFGLLDVVVSRGRDNDEHIGADFSADSERSRSRSGGSRRDDQSGGRRSFGRSGGYEGRSRSGGQGGSSRGKFGGRSGGFRGERSDKEGSSFRSERPERADRPERSDRPERTERAGGFRSERTGGGFRGIRSNREEGGRRFSSDAR